MLTDALLPPVCVCLHFYHFVGLCPTLRKPSSRGCRPAKLFFVRLCLTLRKPLKRLERNFKTLCGWQSASPVVVESDCHLVFFSVWGVFVRLRLTLRKPLKRLDRNFKILRSWQSASPVVVESDCHLLYVFFFR